MSNIPLEVKHPQHWDLLHSHGLIPRLHATHASFHDSRLDAKIHWRSRDHRKGRRVRVEGDHEKVRVRHHWPRLWGFEFGNISWWVAQLFTWGSAVWCVNGWYSLFPLSDEVTTANIVGWTALVGGTLFEAGAYAMVVEAVNRGHTVRFGYELLLQRTHPGSKQTCDANQSQDTDDGQSRDQVKKHLEADIKYLHKVRGSGAYSLTELADKLLPEGGEDSSHEMANGDARSGSSGQPRAYKDDAMRNQSGEATRDYVWKWWGYRWNQLGYVASFITFCGATIFWISTITGVPGVLPAEPTHIAEWDILFWFPQVLGSCCFITAAILFMLETQPSWWHIKPFDLGWHVGFWNLIGGLGFWLCGFFGFFAYPEQKYQRWGMSCSTFWGAWAFLLGSYIQLVEMLN